MGYKKTVYKKFDSKRYFGVELEVGNEKSREYIWSVMARYTHRRVNIADWVRTFRNNYWHVKTDSTCGAIGTADGGYEVVSYKASGYEDMLHIASIAKTLSDHGVRVNENCGLHVHVDVKDFSPGDVGILIAHWIRAEPICLYHVVPLRRIWSPFCQSLRVTRRLDVERYYDSDELWNLFCPTDLNVYENPDRRVNLNIMNYATGLRRRRWTRNTVELRMPEGTLDPVDVKNWIRFFVNFVEFCKGRPMPERLRPASTVAEGLNLLGLGHTEDFYVYSPGLHETRLWFLNRIVKHSHVDLYKNQARELIEGISEPA